MNLTPEERRKVYEEEKAKEPKRIALKVLFVVVLLMFAYVVYQMISVQVAYYKATGG